MLHDVRTPDHVHAKKQGSGDVPRRRDKARSASGDVSAGPAGDRHPAGSEPMLPELRSGAGHMREAARRTAKTTPADIRVATGGPCVSRFHLLRGRLPLASVFRETRRRRSGVLCRTARLVVLLHEVLCEPVGARRAAEAAGDVDGGGPGALPGRRKAWQAQGHVAPRAGQGVVRPGALGSARQLSPHPILQAGAPRRTWRRRGGRPRRPSRG
mmetsp:Transcript_84512/g.239462  ORF Transcript_84512/g.239462 Transcript_84512/m.239462 type:complete len:213 (+) Transcript_84512:1122-1760(+)